MSGGDPSIIESAGMSVKATPSPVGVLPALDNFVVTGASVAGQLSLKWTSLRGASSYILQASTDISSPDNWHEAAISTKARSTITNLTGGTKYWFRVAAIGAAGQGAWSDAAFKIAG